MQEAKDDGIVINEDGEVTPMQNVLKWLVKNELNSDVTAEFDHEFYKT